MTQITLTPFQVQLVMNEHCNQPPIEPPIEPPVEPPIEPPIKPPVPSEDLYDVTWSSIWQTPLVAERSFYQNTLFRNLKAAGTSVRIVVPTLTRHYHLKITDVESTYPSSKVTRYGVLSDRRDFNEPFHSQQAWGVGGSVSMLLGPQDSGRVVYFNHRIKYEADRYAPWMSQLQATFFTV